MQNEKSVKKAKVIGRIINGFTKTTVLEGFTVLTFKWYAPNKVPVFTTSNQLQVQCTKFLVFREEPETNTSQQPEPI